MKEMLKFVKKLLRGVFILIYPKQCMACTALVDSRYPYKLCPICKTKWISAKSALREKLRGTPTVAMPLDGFDHLQSGNISALCEYRLNITDCYEVQRKLIFSLKRNDYSELTDLMADELCELIREVLGDLVTDKNTVVISMPRNRKNLAKEGVDNMRTIGRKLAKRLNFTYYHALEQYIGVKEQKKLTVTGRRKNMESGLYIKSRYISKLNNRRVIIIDDVVTTGSGVRSAAREILKVGKAKQTMVFSITMNPENIARANS